MKITFPNNRDINAVYKLLSDYTRLFCPVVEYRVLDVATSELNPVYLELDASERTWEDAVDLNAYVIPEDETYPLTKYGLEQVRDIALQVAVPDLVTAGFVTQDPDTWEIEDNKCSAGDRFFYSDIEYQVLDVVRGEHFGNSDIPIFFLFGCEKVRPESDKYVGI